VVRARVPTNIPAMRLPSSRATSAILLAVALLSCAEAPTAPERNSVLRAPRAANLEAPTLVISQVYGGGGNAGATYTHDFVELFNPGDAAVVVDGWSVQYASSAGSSWQVTALAGSVAPGGYFLVRQAQGAGGTTPLPTPDALGTIAMSGTAGKIALSSAASALSGVCPVGGTVVDHVGYGGTNCAAGGWTSNTPVLSNTTAAIRNDDGCAFTDSPAADFSVGAPAPRNSASATKECGGVVVDPIAASVVVAPESDTLPVGATIALVATAYDDSAAVIPGEVFVWTSSDTLVATVSSSGVVSGVGEGVATVAATASSSAAADTAEIVVVAAEEPPEPGDTRISEIHYDNVGTDVAEGVELEGPAGASLSGWSLVLYNQTGGAQYSTIALSGVFPSLCEGRGVIVVPTVGIQNGPADGIALVAPGNVVVEFLSYEGTLTASNGPAAGLTSTDIGVDEEPAPAVGRSLQRAPSGTWFGPEDATFGACNGEAPPPPANTIFITGRNATDVPLPVGYQDQLFGNLLDGNGASVPSTYTWSSDSPTIASVDQDGVITALAAGTAIIRATAADSAATTSTISLPTVVATPSVTASYIGNAEFGEPTDSDASDDFIIRYEQFTSSFNRNRGIPNWVSYEIDASHFGDADRCDCFTYDPSLPAEYTRYTTGDYTGAGTFHGYGIDRGHLARSFDRTSGNLDNARTFLFSNIIPQAADVNQGPWALFENHLGDLARFSNKEVYVVTGASGSKGTVKNEGIITIPSVTWKAAVIVDKDTRLADITSLAQVEVLAVLMPNDPGVRNAAWQIFEVTVDSIESVSGYDLLALLRDDIETALESDTRPPEASLSGTLQSLEGATAISLSALASTDPDGDALSFAWDFGDGSCATGAEVSHVYGQDGAYSVMLVVTDVRGLADTIITEATVANDAPQPTPLSGATLIVGESYSASGSFTDSGTLDPWSAFVNYGDGSSSTVALSGKTWAFSHTYTAAGTFTVSLNVSDDDVTSSVAAAVRVLSARQALDSAQAILVALVRARTLTPLEALALAVKIRVAEVSVDRGHPRVAALQLQAALHHIAALVRSRRVTQAEVEPLRAYIARIVDALD